MSRFSFATLLRSRRAYVSAVAFAGAQNPYEVVIIGAGGQGLASAYYLIKEHGSAVRTLLAKAHRALAPQRHVFQIEVGRSFAAYVEKFLGVVANESS